MMKVVFRETSARKICDKTTLRPGHNTKPVVFQSDPLYNRDF